MSDEVKPSAAWQDVHRYHWNEMSTPCVDANCTKSHWLDGHSVERARAADAQQIALHYERRCQAEDREKRANEYVERAGQQIAALRAENEHLRDELSLQQPSTHALNLAAQVRRLQTENAELERHAGIAGEVIQEANNHAVALRQEIARLKRWGTELLVRELMAKERAETAEAQLTALQAEQAQLQQEVIRLRDWYQRWLHRDLTERDHREAEMKLAALTAQQDKPQP